jgi:hypothetical protein
MNTLPPLSPEQEREWTLQQRAVDIESGLAGAEAAPASYRLVARALREPLPVDLPAGFARRVARRVERAALLDARWPQRWTVVLLLALSALVVTGLMLEGAGWLADLRAALPSLPRLVNGWGLLLLLGIGAARWPLPRG